MNTTDHEYEYLRQLVGWTVSHPVRVTNDVLVDDQPYYGLVLTRPDNKKHQLFVRIQCDPEGNGPGHLTIEKEKYGT